MVLHELDRLAHSRRIDQIVLATSTDASDDLLYAAIVQAGVNVYRGSLDDVLERYYTCAAQYGADHIVRVTGDCPLIDWRIVDDVIVRHLAEQNDYTYTTERFPDGLDTEVMTFAALTQAYQEARMPSEREHVTLYFRNHPECFHVGDVDCAENYGDLRWTVDEPEDFLFVQNVYERLYPEHKNFAMQDILDLLAKHSELMRLNEGFMRNEGMKKSLEEDELWKGEVPSCRKSEKEV